jgi:threonine/homoserine/homoserine lactone efflux protein
MTESLITISILGFVAGFIFSMPIAGPVSILITSNALKGRLRYCNLMALGASFADFIYVIIAVYGIANLFSAYKQLIPYILGAGSFFILIVGYKIINTKFDLGHIDEGSMVAENIRKKEKGAFYTGFMINFLNPTIFFGWLVSSFIVLSFAASLGFETGGLDSVVDKNLNQIENIEGKAKVRPQIPAYLQFDTLKILKKENPIHKPFIIPVKLHLLISFFYAFFLSVGSIIWFIILTLIMVRFRKQINMKILNWIVRSLGILLCLFGIFFGYTAIKLLF